MGFKGLSDFSHQQQDKVGVIISNLGTPDAPDEKSLRKYLRQFLSDPRVVEIPRLIWMIILHGIILRTRPKKSAETYKEVWTDRGSPLLYHTEDQRKQIQIALNNAFGEGVVIVEHAMRYGSPSVQEAIDTVLENGARKIVFLPLYPQYSGSTTGSTFDAIAQDFIKRRWVPEFRFINGYYNYVPYIESMAQKIETHWQNAGKADKLIFSFHGVPKRFLTQGDPYHCHCHVTARLLAERLGLEADQWMTTFQSRFGKAEWLKPYTDETMKSLPSQGVKSIQVFCPGFASDCLETIEEIAMENKEYFIENGGESFEYISALNSDPIHISALVQLIKENLSGWMTPETSETLDRLKRYEAHPFNK